MATCVDVVYVEYAEAFDQVDHRVLLLKIRDPGITGHIGKCLASLLTDRTQRARLKRGISNDSPVINGRNRTANCTILYITC